MAHLPHHPLRQMQIQLLYHLKKTKAGTEIEPKTNGIGDNGINPIRITPTCNPNLDLDTMEIKMI